MQEKPLPTAYHPCFASSRNVRRMQTWQLFKTAVASSTARMCGWERLGVANIGEKVTPL